MSVLLATASAQPCGHRQSAQRWAMGSKTRSLRQGNLALWPCLLPPPPGPTLQALCCSLGPGSCPLPGLHAPQAPPSPCSWVRSHLKGLSQPRRRRNASVADARHRTYIPGLPSPAPLATALALPGPVPTSPEALERLSLTVWGAPAPGRPPPAPHWADQHCFLMYLELLSGWTPCCPLLWPCFKAAASGRPSSRALASSGLPSWSSHVQPNTRRQYQSKCARLPLQTRKEALEDSRDHHVNLVPESSVPPGRSWAGFSILENSFVLYQRSRGCQGRHLPPGGHAEHSLGSGPFLGTTVSWAGIRKGPT